jgi:hypothetical protein
VSKIGDFFTWLFISLLLLWITGLIFSSSQCVRVNRAAWPVIYSMGAVELVSQNWTDDVTKLQLLLWKSKGAVGAQDLFEKTVYGDAKKCKK